LAKFKCKNFGSCSLADAGKEFEIAPGGDDKCSECAMTLVPLQDGSTIKNGNGGGNLKFVIAGLVVVVILAAGGYMWWSKKQVVEFKSDESTSAPTAVAPVAPEPKPAVSSEAAPAAPPVAVVPAAQTEVNVGETSARMTCDDATRANRPDAEKICRRAAAVTLLNSGAQAAVAGKLEQAEKDYAAAKDKDADIPELYFNLALLKARQGKGSEVIDNLTLAVNKGFTQMDLIGSEQLFVKLTTDPDFRAKFNKLLGKK